MKIKNWEIIEESTPGEKLPAGGYVATIVNVEDVPSKEYLWIVYDIKEGEHAGHYSDDFGKKNEWAHRFTRSYKDTAEGMFKAFINRVEESNRGFKWDGKDEKQFIGKEVGIVLQVEKYTNDKGEDKERLTVRSVYAAQDIRNGAFKLPEPIDKREVVDAAPSADTYSDVPF